MVPALDVEGKYRIRKRDKGRALAGHSTLDRIELTREAVDCIDPKKRGQVPADSFHDLMTWANKNQTGIPDELFLNSLAIGSWNFAAFATN